MLLLSPSLSPWLHLQGCPQEPGVGERSLQGLHAKCLPLIPTHNCNLTPEMLDGVGSWVGPTGWSFLLPQQLVAVSHSAKCATQWPQGEALYLSACSGRLSLP